MVLSLSQKPTGVWPIITKLPALVSLIRWTVPVLTFLGVCKQVKEKLGSKAVALQLPIGAEENFSGVVDLINNRGIIWNETDKGMTLRGYPVPEDMVEEAKEYREKLLEVCC